MKMLGFRHSGLDPESSGMTEMLLDGIQLGRFWIPAFAGMSDEVHFHCKL
ncbi:MAG: hypothetical protein AB7S77_20865 [Desulfatirhabdiaceae bacterium]